MPSSVSGASRGSSASASRARLGVPAAIGNAIYNATGKRLRSADGASWTTEASDLPFFPGAAARGKSGTFVMVNGGWQTWYEKQQFARSEDGVHWTVLPDGAYKKSHPMRSITVGEGVCPSAN